MSTSMKRAVVRKPEDQHTPGNPFCAAHPEVAGRRNPPLAYDEAESPTLGPQQGLDAKRQHANPATLLRAKRRR
jgi:hypothetical protein